MTHIDEITCLLEASKQKIHELSVILKTIECIKYKLKNATVFELRNRLNDLVFERNLLISLLSIYDIHDDKNISIFNGSLGELKAVIYDVELLCKNI